MWAYTFVSQDRTSVLPKITSWSFFFFLKKKFYMHIGYWPHILVELLYKNKIKYKMLNYNYNWQLQQTELKYNYDKLLD